MFLEGSRTYFGMGSDTVHAYDPFSGELKQAEARDVAHAATVADGPRKY